MAIEELKKNFIYYFFIIFSLALSIFNLFIYGQKKKHGFMAVFNCRDWEIN
jgi:hypothetical protein